MHIKQRLVIFLGQTDKTKARINQFLGGIEIGLSGYCPDQQVMPLRIVHPLLKGAMVPIHFSLEIVI